MCAFFDSKTKKKKEIRKLKITRIKRKNIGRKEKEIVIIHLSDEIIIEKKEIRIIQ